MLKGLKYAKKYKIKKKIINYKNLINSEKDILIELDKNNIQIICLAGFYENFDCKFY
jgi:phosphoribosylglycinamide formyltransferase-1